MWICSGTPNESRGRSHAEEARSSHGWLVAGRIPIFDVSHGNAMAVVPKSYREDDWDASSHWLAAIQLGSVAKPQVLLSIGIFPADNRSSIEQYLDRLGGRQLCSDTRVVFGECD
jgi:hypothetical protein